MRIMSHIVVVFLVKLYYKFVTHNTNSRCGGFTPSVHYKKYEALKYNQRLILY